MLDLSLIRAVILDMDGVIWRGQEPIGDLPAIFNQINRRGWRFVLATNNATRTIDQYVQRISGYGVQLESWQVVNSAIAAADYLKELYPSGGPLYIIGMDGVHSALGEAGFYPAEENVLAVIASMNWNLTYEQLRRATLLIRAGAPLIATNSDRTFPTPEGLAPGAGAILAALVAASDAEPVVVGKPSPAMYHIALHRLQLDPGQVLVIGDRAETDIAGAQAIGCRTALVLSGVTTAEQAQAWQPPPDLIAADLASLVFQ